MLLIWVDAFICMVDWNYVRMKWRKKREREREGERGSERREKVTEYSNRHVKEKGTLSLTFYRANSNINWLNMSMRQRRALFTPSKIPVHYHSANMVLRMWFSKWIYIKLFECHIAHEGDIEQVLSLRFSVD